MDRHRRRAVSHKSRIILGGNAARARRWLGDAVWNGAGVEKQLAERNSLPEARGPLDKTAADPAEEATIASARQYWAPRMAYAPQRLRRGAVHHSFALLPRVVAVRRSRQHV